MVKEYVGQGAPAKQEPMRPAALRCPETSPRSFAAARDVSICARVGGIGPATAPYPRNHGTEPNLRVTHSNSTAPVDFAVRKIERTAT